jgi:hypothetical protein
MLPSPQTNHETTGAGPNNPPRYMTAAAHLACMMTQDQERPPHAVLLYLPNPYEGSPLYATARPRPLAIPL